MCACVCVQSMQLQTRRGESRTESKADFNAGNMVRLAATIPDCVGLRCDIEITLFPRELLSKPHRLYQHPFYNKETMPKMVFIQMRAQQDSRIRMEMDALVDFVNGRVWLSSLNFCSNCHQRLLESAQKPLRRKVSVREFRPASLHRRLCRPRLFPNRVAVLGCFLCDLNSRK